MWTTQANRSLAIVTDDRRRPLNPQPQPAPEPRGVTRVFSQQRVPHALLLALASHVCFGGSAPAGSITLREPFGALRNGALVAPVGFDATELVVAPGLRAFTVAKVVRTEDDRLLEVAPIVEQHGNVIAASGIDPETGDLKSIQFEVWGDRHASLLLRSSLLEVELLPEARARLRLAVFPDEGATVTAIGQMLFARAEVDVLHDQLPVANFRIAEVAQGAQVLDLSQPALRAMTLGNSDCPFVLTTEAVAMDPGFAAQLARQLGGQPAPDAGRHFMLLSGFAAMPDACGRAYFSEEVDLRGPSAEELLLLSSPQPCVWQPTPPCPRPPVEECEWKARPVPKPRGPEAEPVFPPCAMSGAQELRSNIPGSPHRIRWGIGLDAHPKGIAAGVNVALNSHPSSRPFLTPWYGCDPESDSGRFVLKREGDCPCPCEGMISGVASFVIMTAIRPLGAIEASGKMLLKFPGEQPAIAEGSVVHQNHAHNPALPAPSSPEGVDGVALAAGEKRWPFLGATNAVIPGCVILFETATACSMQGRAGTVVGIGESAVFGEIRDSHFKVVLTTVEGRECDWDRPLAIPVPLP